MFFDTKTLEFNKILDILSTFASSSYAKELIKELPISNNAKKITTMLDEVDDARLYQIKYSNPPFAGLSNQNELINRIRLKAVLSISDFLALKDLLYCTKNMINYYKNNIAKENNNSSLYTYFTNLNGVKKLADEIDNVISDEGEIYDTASPALNEIRKRIKVLEQQVRAKMQELLQSKAKMLNENLIVMRNGRMCLCVKAEYKNVLKGVIHDESASKTTVYIEPFSALEIANRIVGYKEEEKTEIAKILAQLSNVAFGYELEIKNNFNNLIALDIIFAKALYAISIDAYKPSINEMGIIDIKKARHPLIDRQKCVPIDIKLGEDYEAIIITGPNTGGKTVAIKTCGLLTLMMQAGLLIPASFDSKMAVFDNVFSDIGDEQSIEQSLSSFSAHMTKVIKILNELTNNSLVLLDELGSGTDPKEGSNLAISIVEYLLNKKSRVIVTTHYADLKAFAYDKDNIINASVEFDTKTLRPTYKLLLGVPGRSNAITIARGLGLNEEIINRSIELNETNHTDLSLMLSKLDDQNTILSEQIAKYEKENLALNERLAKLQAKELKLESEYASFINKAKKEANEIIVKAQEDALALISEIEKKHENFKEHELAELKHQARQLEVIDVDTPTITDFKVGDEVFVKGWQRNGKITKINKDKYEVLVGNFTVTFTKNELSVAKTVTKPVTKPKKYNSPGPVKKEAKLECDLRGFRYEEVAPELDLFIDKAYLAGLSQIYVIHGFGTGAVRKACYEFFKKCPHVKSTRFGGEGEGLNGVTVVYLK